MSQVNDSRHWFRRRYGSGPGHLLLMLACFAFAGYVVNLIVQVPQAWRIAVWLLGSVLFHDLVLWPVYALADRVNQRMDRSRPRRRSGAVPWVNHVRVPTVLAALLLIVSFPLVLGMASSYQRAVGLAPSGYTGRYLLIVSVLYGASALLYLGRLVRRRFGGGVNA